MPNAQGIDLFSEGDSPSTLSRAALLRDHTGATRGHNQASFGFNVAKRDAKKAGVDVKRTGADLQADPAFVVHRRRGTRGGRRDERAVQRTHRPHRADPIEVYAAVALDTLALDTVEFSAFETH